MNSTKQKLSEEAFGDVRVFNLSGRITGGSESKFFIKRIEDLISENILHFVMNFKNVQWMNSDGIGSLIACLRIIRKSGGDLHFANINNVVEIYFRVSRLETVVKIFDNVPEAVKGFSSQHSE